MRVWDPSGSGVRNPFEVSPSTPPSNLPFEALWSPFSGKGRRGRLPKGVRWGFRREEEGLPKGLRRVRLKKQIKVLCALSLRVHFSHFLLFFITPNGVVNFLESLCNSSRSRRACLQSKSFEAFQFYGQFLALEVTRACDAFVSRSFLLC